MISTPVEGGVAFSSAADGDQRLDEEARDRFCLRVGVAKQWATVKQVHGRVIHRVEAPGDHGPGDGIWTTEPGVPIAVFTADCFGIVMHSPEAVGVAHAGWRGTAAGVVSSLYDDMVEGGHEPESVFIGPGIGPCCFEVGPEVVREFPADSSRTSWGTRSVDLTVSIRNQVGSANVWTSGVCTHHESGLFSHRRDGAKERMVTLAWI